MKYLFLFFLFFIFACSNNETKKENIIKTQEKKIILALGDSLTAGYGVLENENYPSKLQKILDENLYNYEVINAGISGDTSTNIKSRASLYLEQKPEIVVLVIGGNDGLRGLSTIDLKNNIIDTIDIFSGSKIILGGMDIPANLGEKYKNDFKKVFSEIATEKKNIYFFEFFLNGVAGNPNLNIDDLIHPNSLGYDIIVKNLFEFLKEKNILKNDN